MCVFIYNVYYYNLTSAPYYLYAHTYTPCPFLYNFSICTTVVPKYFYNIMLQIFVLLDIGTTKNKNSSHFQNTKNIKSVIKIHF